MILIRAFADVRKSVDFDKGIRVFQGISRRTEGWTDGRRTDGRTGAPAATNTGKPKKQKIE